jgi:Zn-dependent protease with chaperone function
MTFDARLAVVTLAAFAVANLAGCAIVPWLWRRRAGASVAALADQLRYVRVLPVLFASASMTLAALSFAFFEPRQPEEAIGRVMVMLAAVAAALIATALLRWGWLLFTSGRVLRAWMDDAKPTMLDGFALPTFSVSSHFPIVAVVGVWRPRLIIARSVLSACTPEEIRAIVAHEHGHVVRRDNAMRLLLTILPDVLSWLPISRRLLDAWHAAAEDAADDHAASIGADGRVLLAQALLRVARLAPAGSAAAVLPVSALYRGENIERRVRRLLDPLPPPAARQAAWLRATKGCVGMTVSVLALHAVHELLEAAVTFLP